MEEGQSGDSPGRGDEDLIADDSAELEDGLEDGQDEFDDASDDAEMSEMDDVDEDDIDSEDIDGEDIGDIEVELSSKEQSARTLEIRRALEERREQQRLNEDLDYLDFDLDD